MPTAEAIDRRRRLRIGALVVLDVALMALGLAFIISYLDARSSAGEPHSSTPAIERSSDRASPAPAAPSRPDPGGEALR